MNKLKEINGKYYQECKVVMLATDDKAAPILSYLNDKSLQYFPNTYWSNGDLSKRHLYFLSNKEIKEGDWCINSYDNQIWKYKLSPCPLPYWGNKDTLTKIIATTDTSLGLPQPSSQFILKYIELYNAGTPIKWVNVEYEEYFESNIVPLSNFVDEEQLTTKYKLKVDKNNHITITKVKDSWSKEEVIAIFEKARIDIMDMTFDGDFPECYVSKEELFEWIEENL